MSMSQDQQTKRASGIPVSPALGPTLDAANMPYRSTMVRHRVLLISILAIFLGVAGAYVSQLLMFLINLLTAFCFYGDVSIVHWPNHEHPSMISLYEGVKDGHLGAWIMLMPVIGGFMAGIMARFGSRAIQGHGIPEAVEGILANESRISPKLAWLKPVSAAFAMGTGGPFGPEGPIIATGGALGSLMGQLIKVTANERKTLLAAGAAAGMAATFGAPVASLILAIEVMLFEVKARSMIPVAIAVTTGVGVRYATLGSAPVFIMPEVVQSGALALICYAIVGAVVGYGSVWVTRFTYFVEDTFAKIPSRIHWMWWPVMGAFIAGFIGWIDPRTLGVGYDNIDALLDGDMAELGLVALLSFGTLKFLSWSISLGSGTSGGTLAPLFMIGGSLGGAIGYILNMAFPSFEINVGLAALVGMGAIFSGSARALLTAIVFSYEATREPGAMLPLLAGCSTAYLISAFTMRTTIMSEKIERRGLRVPSGYSADYLTQITVGDVCAREIITIHADDTVGAVRRWLRSDHKHTRHQGFPIVDRDGRVLGVITQRYLFDPQQPDDRPVRMLIEREPLTCFESHTLRDAADHMVKNGVGRLIVVGHESPHPMVGLITRGDVLRANAQRIHENTEAIRQIDLRKAILRTDSHPTVTEDVPHQK